VRIKTIIAMIKIFLLELLLLTKNLGRTKIIAIQIIVKII
jgi:hypothetical protein